MGTWGTGITSDDTVSDIVSFVSDRLKSGTSIEVATAEAIKAFAELEREEDEAPLLWLSLAFVQWKFGKVDDHILDRVRRDTVGEQGLGRWRDDPKAFAKRKAVLAKFLSQIEAPNPKPSKPPKPIVRQAPFTKGDCLSVLLPDGRFTAALVLQVDNSNPEFGKNQIAVLDYLGTTPPTKDIFVRKEWLILKPGKGIPRKDISWYLPVRFRQNSKRITVVGNINLGWFIPKGDGLHCAWDSLGLQILSCQSDAVSS